MVWPSACCGLLWGFQQALAKATLAEVPPMFQVSRRQWGGLMLALVAGMAWGLTTVTIRGSVLTKVSATKMLLYPVGVGAAWNFRFSGFAISSLLPQTVVGAFASDLAWMWILGHYPATKISVFMFSTPVFSMLICALWLKGPVTLRLVAALARVAGGIVLVNWQRARPVRV
jgi:drug/metabolite transporter (DMT)-like permease